MTDQPHSRTRVSEIALAGLALGSASLAVTAWAACCVLPIALSIVGVTLAGTALLAEQRDWLTLATLLVLGAGWSSVWRRRRACARDSACARPSRLMIGLLSAASALTLATLVWQPIIEPWALSLARSVK